MLNPAWAKMCTGSGSTALRSACRVHRGLWEGPPAPERQHSNQHAAGGVCQGGGRSQSGAERQAGRLGAAAGVQQGQAAACGGQGAPRQWALPRQRRAALQAGHAPLGQGSRNCIRRERCGRLASDVRQTSQEALDMEEGFTLASSCWRGGPNAHTCVPAVNVHLDALKGPGAPRHSGWPPACTGLTLAHARSCRGQSSRPPGPSGR